MLRTTALEASTATRLLPSPIWVVMLRAQKIPRAMKTTPEPQDCTSRPMEPHLLHGRALSAIQHKCFQMPLPAKGSSSSPALGALGARSCQCWADRGVPAPCYPSPTQKRSEGVGKPRAGRPAGGQASRLCWVKGRVGSDGSRLLSPENLPRGAARPHLEAGQVGFR